MNLPSAASRFGAPVKRMSAVSSITRATSAFGQSWFGCIKALNSAPFVTLTILPGAERGLKPLGGVAAPTLAPAARLALVHVLAAAPARAPVTPKKLLRER